MGRWGFFVCSSFLIDGLGVNHLVANCTNRGLWPSVQRQAMSLSDEVDWPKPTGLWILLSMGGAIIGAILTCTSIKVLPRL